MHLSKVIPVPKLTHGTLTVVCLIIQETFCYSHPKMGEIGGDSDNGHSMVSILSESPTSTSEPLGFTLAEVHNNETLLA